MAQEELNYYQILGIPDSAGAQEIRAVYRRLAFEYHPDRNSDPGAQEYFQKIIEAFSVLSDPERRLEYDAILFSESLVIKTPSTIGLGPVSSMMKLPEILIEVQSDHLGQNM
jgi:curved DNA-binding protein CbpA